MKKQLRTRFISRNSEGCNTFFSKKIFTGKFLGIVGIFLFAFAMRSELKAQVTVTGSTGADGPYTTLKLAFDAINLNGVQAGNNITVVLSANTTETATAALNQPATSSWTSLSITCSAPVTVSGSIAGAIVKLNGADNVTIDGRIGGTGRNITISNSNTGGTTAAGTAAVWISSTGVGLGATGNTIRNCEIACGATQNTSTSVTYGIIMCGAAITLTSDGNDNDNNSFIDNRIIRCRIGISTRGATTNNNQNIMVSDNLIGPASFGADEIGLNGIFMQADNNSTITRNTVQFVGGNLANTTAGADRVGIAIGVNAWTSTTTGTLTSANYTVTRNLVHDIIEERTFSAVGIICGTTQGGAPTNNLICSNMIYNVRANATPGDQTVGIGHIGHRGDKIVYNSILMTGDLDPAGTSSASTNPIAAGIAIHSSSAADTAITVKNNIVHLDLTSNTATLLKACIIAPAVGYLWGTGGSNYNDYWIPNFLNGNVTGVTGTGTTSYSTLANWQAAYTPAQDGSSIQADPVFASSTDLHINPSSAAVNNLGTPVSCTIDFDNQARSGTPDIGADEYVAVPPPSIDAGVTVVTANPPSPVLCAGIPVTLTATVKNFGTMTQNAITVYYTVNAGPAIGPVIAVGPIVFNGTVNVVFSGANSFIPPSTGIYTIKVYTSLASDAVATNDTTTIVYNVLGVSQVAVYPHIETFDPPVTDWTVVVEAAIGSTALWGLQTATGPDGVIGNWGAKANFYNGNAGRIERLQSPVLDFSSLSSPVLHYYLAHRSYTGPEDDKLEIVISTDCGLTFYAISPTPYSKQNSSVPSLSTLPGDGTAFTPSALLNWRHESIDLGDYAGISGIVVGFRAISDFGNNLWLDQVVISDANSICDDAVTSSGTYSCDGTASFLMTNTGDPAGGTLQVTNYTTAAPNPVVAMNVTATTPDGSIFTPESVNSTKWFKATYSGNTFNGYANYDISIDVTGFTPVSNVDQMYIMKRADQLSDWICVPTTAIGNVLTAAGLNTFSDFAIGYTLNCSNPTATVSGGGTVCLGDPLPDVSITLTGNGPWDITYFDGANSTMVSGIIASPYVIVGAPAGTYTVTAISDADCEGTASGSAVVTVNSTPVTCPAPGYIDICEDTPIFELTVSSPSGGTYSGPGVTANYFDASDAGVGTHIITYTYEDGNNCESECMFLITVHPNSYCASSLTWVLLPSGGACGSTTDCCNDIFCYGLEYTPGVTGTLTTYTTGYFLDCIGLVSPVISNVSCVMDDASAEDEECEDLGMTLINSSGNTGSVPVTKGVPIIIHKLCLTLPDNVTLDIVEDLQTDLTLSVDYDFGAIANQFPDYDPVMITKSAPEEPLDGSDIVECPDDAVFPDLPEVLDVCGSTIPGTLVSISDEEDPIECEGQRIYTYSFTDCGGFTVDWTFTYTIDFTDLNVPGNGGSTVSCLAQATNNPGAPDILDACGRTVSGALIGSTTPPLCEGTVDWTFRYTACDGTTTADWTYTYTIDYSGGLEAPENDGSTVSCPDDATNPGAPAPILDACGRTVTAGLIGSTTPPVCEGPVVWTYRYTACDGTTTADWTYTYTINYSGGLDAPDNDGSIVSCPDDATVPGAPAPILDACGRTVTAGLIGSTEPPVCEGEVVWTYRYTACDGTSTADWTYTYTINYSGGLNAPGNTGSTVECPDEATNPGTPDDIVDACGRTVTAGLIGSTTPPVCEGSVIWTYRYTACDGTTTDDWTFTYNIDRTIIPSEVGGPVPITANVTGIANAIPPHLPGLPDLPVVQDYCGSTVTGSLFDIVDNPITIVCNGTRTFIYRFTDCAGLNYDWSFEYTIDNVPVPVCPNDITVCESDSPFALDDATPPGGDYSGPGVDMNTFDPFDAGEGNHTITYTYTNAQGCPGVCMFDIFVKPGPIVTCRPNAAVCISEPAFLMTGQSPPGGDYNGDGVTGAMFNPAVAGLGPHVITYTAMGENGCSSTCSFIFNVTNCPGDPIIEIIPLDPCDNGGTNGSCVNQSDCCENILCFAIQYTPGYSGDLTTYTTGFFTDCIEAIPANPVYFNESCVMFDNSFLINECEDFNMVLFNSSGHSGMVPITAGVPIIIHQVCLTVPPGVTLDIDEDEITNLSTSIDLTGGGFVTEYPDFIPGSITRTGPELPDDGTATVACLNEIILPEPPVGISQCCEEIEGILDSYVDVPDPLTCEGTRIYSYTYEDCGGATSTWTYTVTVEYEPFADPQDGGTTIECIDDIDLDEVPLPIIFDNCGVTLVPTGPTGPFFDPDPFVCGGTVRYTWNFEDCVGNSQDWNYIYTVDCDPVTVKVFLEGPYDSDDQLMGTLLNYYHILPGQDPDNSPNLLAQLIGVTTPAGQPYFLPPFYYNGNEGDDYGDDPGDIPYAPTIVDWILLSVRAGDSSATSEVWKCAALLHNDGEVEIPIGCPCLQTTPGTDYYIVVEHRNHLAVMSTKIEAVGGALSFDFTQNQSWIYSPAPMFFIGHGQKLIGSNYVMFGGNSDQLDSRQDINATDNAIYLSENNSLIIYRRADHNMDGDVNATDNFYWLVNNGKFTVIPF